MAGRAFGGGYDLDPERPGKIGLRIGPFASGRGRVQRAVRTEHGYWQTGW